jgi:hypothetical protein
MVPATGMVRNTYVERTNDHTEANVRGIAIA